MGVAWLPATLLKAGSAGTDAGHTMRKMYWRLRTLTRRDISGILLAIVLLAALAFLFVVFPNLGQQTNEGFGPEWDCTNPGQGGPICVKKQPIQGEVQVRTGQPPVPFKRSSELRLDVTQTALTGSEEPLRAFCPSGARVLQARKQVTASGKSRRGSWRQK
jgi:hypothetical protein